MQTKDKISELISKKPRLAVSVVAGVASILVLFSLGALEPASAQFEVCTSDGLSGQAEAQFRALTQFIVGAAVIGALLLAMVDHLKHATNAGGSDNSEPIHKSSKLKAAIMLPIGLYFIEFALSAILDVSVTCIMPWGS